MQRLRETINFHEHAGDVARERALRWIKTRLEVRSLSRQRV